MLYLHNLGIDDKTIELYIREEKFANAVNDCINSNLSDSQQPLEINLSTNCITSTGAIQLINHLLDVSSRAAKPPKIILDLSNNDLNPNPELWALLCNTCNLSNTVFAAESKNLEGQIYQMIAAPNFSINILENPMSCFRLNQMKKFRIA